MLRSLLLALSEQSRVRAFAEHSATGRKVSHRFVAGMSIEDALAAAQQCQNEGMFVSLDALGESVTTEAEALASAAVYHQLLDAIATRGLNANVSLKLTQMGLDLDAPEAALTGLAYRTTAELVEHAARCGNFVRIDMEGTPYTDHTLALTEALHTRWPEAVGTVLQAYLYRTAGDAERLLGQGIRVRLCKGAYKEGPEHAFPQKTEVDANYIRLMQRMLVSGVYCGIATHDEAMITATRAFVTERGLARDVFEFQMLYGIRRDLQQALVREGYRVRVYIPFGPAWYPYFMRRLAERPANVLFLLKNLLR